MATNGNPPTWVPYQGPKDCSQGFCSIYCPQWCYIIFPPPPPLDLADDSSGPAFSPLVIAIIGILASAFLLVSYYTIVSKYCGGFDALRRRLTGPPSSAADRDADDGAAGHSRRHDTWHVSPSNGLDEALINKIAVYKYSRRDGLVDGTDCSVCLSEFREEERLRLLPKCCHAFHLQCIDTWLKSHSSCPLCRSNIVSPLAGPVQLSVLPEAEHDVPHPAGGEGRGRDDEIVVVVEDFDCHGEEEETQSGGNHHPADAPNKEDPAQIRRDLGGMWSETNGIAEIRDDDGVQQIRRSFSMDSVHRCRVSIADVLQLSMEDELMVAKDHGLLVSAGSSRQGRGEHSYKNSISRTRDLHCVISPVPMKRSLSSGRFCFTKQGRGRNAVLPL